METAVPLVLYHISLLSSQLVSAEATAANLQTLYKWGLLLRNHGMEP